ncbi:MAG: S8 family serine peptidase [Burkholderiales bacterium]|nr:S8 family serine peptidase [Burkholderiales bacterium]
MGKVNMVKKASTHNSASDEMTLWRGGQPIKIEKQEDRFTLFKPSAKQIERLAGIAGVQSINRVNRHVCKVQTTSNDRDNVMATMRAEGFKAVAHHAYKPVGSEGTMYYLTDKIVVNFKPKTSVRQIEALLAKYKLALLKEYALPDTVLVQVTTASGANPLKIANRIAAEKVVNYAEPNLVNRHSAAYTPPDGLFKRQWHLQSRRAAQLAKDASVDAPLAWDTTRGKRSIVVAVVDDGFDINHPDLKGDNKIVQPRDFVDGGAKPFPDGDDYHGTPCAGVAIAEENGSGVVGIAPGCAFMPVRISMSEDDDRTAEILLEVAAHADVISCSWGPAPVFAPLSRLVFDTITRITRTGGPRGKGSVMCFAAHNFNAPLRDLSPPNNVRWKDNGQLRVTNGPIENGYACHPDVVAVSASTSLNRKAQYSNWGDELSVCAPSDNWHPLDDQAYTPGRGVWTTDNEGVGAGFTDNSRYTGSFGGTSSATPLVAGVAALVLSANPKLTALQVKAILQQTADKIVDKNKDEMTGNSFGTYNNKGYSRWFGYGKVNAARAVAEAVRRL